MMTQIWEGRSCIPLKAGFLKRIIIFSILTSNTVAFNSPLSGPYAKKISLHPMNYGFLKKEHQQRKFSPYPRRLATETATVEWDIADLSEKELLQSILDYKNAKRGNGELQKPPKHYFVSLMEHWLTFPSPSRAEGILDRMEEMYTPSGRIYERIINAWCFEAMESDDDLIVNDINLIDEDSLESNLEDPDEESLEEELKEIKRKNLGFAAAKKAAILLDRMEVLYRETTDLDFRPAPSTYTSVVNALIRSSKAISSETESITAREMAEEIRQKRQDIYESPNMKQITFTSDRSVFDVLRYLKKGANIWKNLEMKKQPTTVTRQAPLGNRNNFNTIINELAKEGKPWAAQAAEDILEYMIRCHISEEPRLKPNIESINGCLNAWAQTSSKTSDSADRAEGILSKLNKRQTSDGLLLDVTPDNISYNTMIKAFSNSGNAKRAEGVLNTMEKLFESTGDEKIRPDLISFSSVLNAYAKSAMKDAGSSKRAENILFRMIKNEEFQDDGQKPVKPNTWCFNTVLNGHAARGAGNRAVLLLKLMEDMSEKSGYVQPDIYSYNTVLKALAKSHEKGSIDRAVNILDRMEEKSKKGKKSVTPDAVSYNTLILAYANGGGKFSGKAAETVLRRMERMYHSGNELAKPNTATYTSVIKAWTRGYQKESTSKAEELVKELVGAASNNTYHVHPDTTVYNSLLHCWAKSGERVAAKRAQEILLEMEEEYLQNGNGSVKPNYRTYTTVIDVLAKSRDGGAADKALEILKRMESLYKAGEVSVRPNVYSYTAVINCFARSRQNDKAVRAVEILQLMEEEYRSGNDGARPNEVAYNSVLNACAYTYGNKEAIETAFKIACLVFDEIRSSDYLGPTHVTYGTFLSVCANLMPESRVRDNLVEATFRRCSREGLVSDMVWRNLEAGASATLLDTLLQQRSEGELRAQWSRNMP